MVIYLKHEKHGTKVAISEAEALADEKNGWKRYVIGEEKPVLEVVSNTLRVKRPYNRKTA